MTPVYSGQHSFLTRSAHHGSPGNSASRPSFTHHRTPLSSSHSDSHQSYFARTPAVRDFSHSHVHGSSSWHDCFPKDRSSCMKLPIQFPVTSGRSRSVSGCLEVCLNGRGALGPYHKHHLPGLGVCSFILWHVIEKCLAPILGGMMTP